MPETTAKQDSWSQSTESGTEIWLSYIEHLHQEEAIAYFPHGRIRGRWTSRKDIQSDDPYPLTEESIRQVLQKLEMFNFFSKSEYSSYFEEPTELVAVEEVETRDIETTYDDISQWTSDQLASAILHPQAESDMPRLRQMIFVAEDSGFTVAESEQLAPWLLSFAERHRDSSDPQDEASVWSAIRTGASMLRPDTTDRLRPLLEPGHSIETSLVTVKMLGRIFEAQPPAELDEHQDLADKVFQIAEPSLNPHVITASQIAAKAQLAIYALGTMASSKIHGIVKSIQTLDAAWFTQQTLRELRELANIWANRPVPVADQPQELLDRVIKALE